MIIIEQATDLAGKIRATCQLSNGTVTLFKFAVQPTQAQLDEIEASYIDQHQYDDVNQEVISVYDHVDLIKEFVKKIKDNPGVTLVQYNTWLSTKPWYDQAILRFFVFKLATGLAAHHDVALPDMTEAQVLGKVRDWIVATPSRKIAKVILNSYDI